jgi:hypothetical protein
MPEVRPTPSIPIRSPSVVREAPPVPPCDASSSAVRSCLAIGAVVSLTLTVIECMSTHPVLDRPAGKPDAGITRDASTVKQGGMGAEKAADESAQFPAEKASLKAGDKAK